MTTVATVLIKLKTPSPITAVVKRLLAGAGRPTLALTPAPPKGVVKSTLPLKVKRGNISKDLHEKIDKKNSYALIFYKLDHGLAKSQKKKSSSKSFFKTFIQKMFSLQKLLI